MLSVQNTRVCILGMGYVGLPLGLAVAKAGFAVRFGEISERKLELARRATPPLTDITEGMAQDFTELTKNGRISAAPPEQALVGSQLKIICVPTPMFLDRRPDLRFVREATRAIGIALQKDDLVINESTVAPGMTRREIVHRLEAETGLRAGTDFFAAASPERIDPGNTVHTFHNTPRIVGGINVESTSLALSFYEMIGVNTIEASSLEVAEATKILENSYRALNIGFVNEFARYCEAVKIDVMEVLRGASTKWTFQAHYPSIGVGGPCIPKDPYYLISAGEEVGGSFHSLWNAVLSNERMPYHLFNTLKTAASREGVDLRKAKVAILGIAYKKDVSDCRESPAIVFATVLQREGIEVSIHDPIAASNPENSEYIKAFKRFDPEADTAEIVVIGCDHSMFKSIDFSEVRGLRFVLDGRNMFERLSVPLYGVGRTIRSRQDVSQQARQNSQG